MPWELDTSHSSVKWSARWNNLVKMGGPFKQFRCKLDLDDNDPLKGEIEAVVESPSFDSFVYRMNARLLSPAYLEAWKYPNITFKTKSTRPGEDNTHFMLVGDLTLRDVTKEIEVLSTFNGEATGRAGNIVRGYSSVISIPWKDFLDGPPPTDAIDLFSDIITVNVEIVAGKR